MKIVLVRHGESVANAASRLGGQTDYDLSLNGVEELEKYKNEVNYPKVDKYYVSDLTRAVRTANILFGNQEYNISPLLREIDFGSLDGKQMPWQDMRDYVSKWRNDEHNLFGETFSEFQKRIMDKFNEIIAECQKDNLNSFMIVSHAGVMRVILFSLGFKNVENYFDYDMSNGLGYIIENDILTSIK